MSTTSPTGPLIGGRYRLGARLGSGAMGTVFVAVDEQDGGEVAVKMMAPPSPGVDRREHRGRFEREVFANQTIEHPNTVRILDHGETDGGKLYLVMERLDGVSLTALFRTEAPLPVRRAVRLGAQLARALEATHARGVIHRDLKSDNVMVVEDGGEERVKLLDFGLAYALDRDGFHTRLTRSDVRVGNPRTMAPEYIDAPDALDHRADLYALGVVLFEALTGTPPFLGNAQDLMMAHLSSRVPRLRDRRRDAPVWLDRLVTALLAKEPSKRPRSAAQVARVLEEGPGRASRVQWPIVATVVVVLAGVAGFVVWVS